MSKQMTSAGNVANDPHDCNCGRDAKTCPWAITPPMSRGERVPSPSCPEIVKHPGAKPPAAVSKVFAKGQQPTY